MDLSTSISIASLILSAASIVWIGGFRMSAVIHEVKTLRVDMQKLETRMEKGFEKIEQRFEKLENKLESLQTEFHKMDIRVTTIEQRKN